MGQKNLLVFIPVVTSGNLLNQVAWYRGFKAFLAFCAVASTPSGCSPGAARPASRFHCGCWHFLFFLLYGLANVKRVSELSLLKRINKKNSVRRGYNVDDIVILQMMGVASSFVSCLVLALYVQSNAVIELYAQPRLLWFLIPVILFWQFHIWLSTARGQMRDDPIVYAAKDWVSWAVGILVFAVLMLAKFPI